MNIEDIIKDKLERLNTIPDKFISATEKSQKELYIRLLELLSSLEKKDDIILKTKKNITKIDKIISALRDQLETGEYLDGVKDFMGEFKKQQLLTEKYFSAAFPLTLELTQFSKEVANVSRKNAAELLLGSATEDAFFNPIREQITNSIFAGSSYKETIDSLRQIVIGDTQKDGVLQAHVKQISHDAFAIADRSYTAVLSDEIGAEWFKYKGSEIKTSRPFCVERHERYFHKKEIEAWGKGEKTEGLETPDKTGHWSGEFLGTTAQTIFSLAGGYNCRHSILPVSIERVPKSDIQRAIDQGFINKKVAA